MISVDDQLVVIKVLTRFSVHLRVEASQPWKSPLQKRRSAYRVVALRWPSEVGCVDHRRVFGSGKNIIQ